ncbi:hypothetical protein Angca_005093 [Angiostrongylus cantonensis]|nr:hypothetical protein Angca_005093 [Angiostrongylus cantonensis]
MCRMPNPSPQSSDHLITSRSLGIILLLLVNVLWVLTSELTRYVFVDEGFRRPFFTAYVKTCMLTVYMVRYLACERVQEVYRSHSIVAGSLIESEKYGTTVEKHSDLEGYETMTSDSEYDLVQTGVSRAVRFAEHREVRRMPEVEASEARLARQPYSPPLFVCPFSFNIQSHVRHTVFFFAPMWLLCTFTYQAALMFTSVSALNMISSSSPLFVLVFSICFPSSGSKFTLLKAFFVVMNFGGVLIVSEFSSSLTGSLFAQISAVSYALYITLYTRYQERSGDISINLMFGSIGMLAVFGGTPLLFVFDAFSIEKLHPLPNREQIGIVFLSGLFGTLLADYLWLTAAALTDSLSASLSMTLAIPFSFFADAVLQRQLPSRMQLLAAIPITVSFIAAALLDHKRASPEIPDVRQSSGEEDEAALLENDES